MTGLISQFNIPGQCKKYGVSLWQCPQFLFLIMGLVIIITSIASYFIGNRYVEEPELVALIVITITTILFILAFTIVKSFESLADASRLKSEFINIVSHQLRAPLSNMKWSVELLTSDKYQLSEDKEKSYFVGLEENIQRTSELVDDLLLVSRIEQGSLPQRKTEVSFEKLTRELISQFKSHADALGVVIVFSSQDSLPNVFIDPSQIKIAIENLIDNALHYTKRGGKVDMRLERKNSNIHFKIKDSGIGIPKGDQKFIFQKFFRAENISKESKRGSGLGLFITKTIIEKSGGKIWFESEENKGTTFYFTLPIK